MNNRPATVDETLQLIRERMRVRMRTHSASGMEVLQRRIELCKELQNRVGTINPREAGLHNDFVQFVKKMMARSLTWYTRPVREFHAAVTQVLVELYGNVTGLEERVTDNEDALSSNIEQMKREVLASAESYAGPKGTAGLWFNDPIHVTYDGAGRPVWSGTSERIVEKAWALRHLAPLSTGAKLLDVGCCESTLPLELASSGMRVTGIDVRPYSLQHPNLHFVQGDLTNVALEPEGFDAAILLSTVEHLGLGWYGDPKGEEIQKEAMAQVHRFLKPGGYLVLTAPFGKRAITPLHCIFDPVSIRELLTQFTILQLEFGVRLDNKTWIVPMTEREAEQRTHDPVTYSPGAVAMAFCQKP